MNNDNELLRRFTEERSESAFADLVQRHIGLVYSTARRRVGQDAHHAEDVTQTVFLALARHARQLLGHASVGGWLYVTTQHASAELVRREQRRKTREATAQAMHLSDSSDQPPVDADQIRPVLDHALMSLPAVDRDAIVLRYFEDRSFADIGTALKLSEDAARKRVDRSLDKLHGILTRRGIATPAAALGGTLTAIAAVNPPSGLALSVASNVYAQVGAASAAGASLLSSLLPAAAAATLVIGAAVVVPQYRANAALADELARTGRAPIAETALRSEIDGLQAQLRQAATAVPTAPLTVTSPAAVAPAKVAPVAAARDVYIADEGTIAWENEMLTLDDYMLRLGQLSTSQGADSRVVIRTGDRVFFSQMNWAADEARKAGIAHLIIECKALPEEKAGAHNTWF